MISPQHYSGYRDPPIWCYPYAYSRFDQEVAGSQSVLKTDYSLLYQHQAAMLPASQNIAKSQPKKWWQLRGGGQIFTNSSCIKNFKNCDSFNSRLKKRMDERSSMDTFFLHIYFYTFYTSGKLTFSLKSPGLYLI